MAQQAFSADRSPSLHDALPAIEALHAAWSKRSVKEKYSPFGGALDAASAKLDEYYTKTAASDAHVMAMGPLNLVLALLFFIFILNSLNSFTSEEEAFTFSKVLEEARDRRSC